MEHESGNRYDLYHSSWQAKFNVLVAIEHTLVIYIYIFKKATETDRCAKYWRKKQNPFNRATFPSPCLEDLFMHALHLV